MILDRVAETPSIITRQLWNICFEGCVEITEGAAITSLSSTESPSYGAKWFWFQSSVLSMVYSALCYNTKLPTVVHCSWIRPVSSVNVFSTATVVMFWVTTIHMSHWCLVSSNDALSTCGLGLHKITNRTTLNGPRYLVFIRSSL